MAIEVRRAVPQEYDAAGEVTVGAYVADGLLNEDEGYGVHLRDAAGRADQAELVVAIEGGAVLGSVTYCPPGSPMRELGEDGDGEFRMLAVAPAARGRGVGRLLVQYCLDRAAESGCGRIRICSLPAMHPAHALYASVGFRRAPELDWRPHPDVLLLGFERP